MQTLPTSIKKTMLAAFVAATCAATVSTTSASSHREAPFITANPKVDATDFYMFRSYEPGREGYVTLVANYNPLQDPYGGPNYFSMSPDALYEIHIDNGDDAQEDITFQFNFNNILGNGGKGITLPIDGKDIAVPLKNIGAVTSSDDSALNFKETYNITMVNGDRRTGAKSPVIAASSGSETFTKPFDNVGNKTFGVQSYNDYAKSFIHNITLSACPSGAQDGRVFVGQRKDSFAVNLGEIFDLVNTNPLGPVDAETDDLADKNVTTIALEVPIACLTGGNNNGIIGAWTTASLPQVRVLDPTPTFDQPAVNGGAWTQVSRLSMPLVNEVVIGLPDKNKFNSSEPKDDLQFADYVFSPSLPQLLGVLFGVTPPTVKDRPDLVATFLTGFAGVNANGSLAEMQRLNTTVAPTPKATQSNFGVVGGDLAGFPNGRRPGDDTVDVALRVVMGKLCHLPLNLCTPEDAPSGELELTDGVVQNASQFDAVFPYLTTPIPGATK
jgi:hypothetical protein